METWLWSYLYRWHDNLKRQLQEVLRQNHSMPGHDQAPQQGYILHQGDSNNVPQNWNQRLPVNQQFHGNQHQNQRQARPQGQGQNQQPQRMVLPQNTHQNQPRAEGHSQVFGREGQPMQINRQHRTQTRCNRCRRTGHWARECRANSRQDGTPLPPQHIRGVWQEPEPIPNHYRRCLPSSSKGGGTSSCSRIAGIVDGSSRERSRKSRKKGD